MKLNEDSDLISDDWLPRERRLKAAYSEGFADAVNQYLADEGCALTMDADDIEPCWQASLTKREAAAAIRIPPERAALVEQLQRVGNIVANLAHPKGDHRENMLEDEAHDLLREVSAALRGEAQPEARSRDERR